VLSDKESQLIFSGCFQQIYRFSRGVSESATQPFFWVFAQKFHGVAAGVARQPVPVDFVGFFRSNSTALRFGLTTGNAT
jgi:hypothetical protein